MKISKDLHFFIYALFTLTFKDGVVVHGGNVVKMGSLPRHLILYYVKSTNFTPENAKGSVSVMHLCSSLLEMNVPLGIILGALFAPSKKNSTPIPNREGRAPFC